MTRRRIIWLNRLKLWISRIFIVIGISIILFDYYLVYHHPWWNFNLMLAIFLTGIFLILLGFAGKFWRRIYFRLSRTKGNLVGAGECLECGACCKIPLPCIFLAGGRCKIYEKRPKQCREFPKNKKQLISYNCGYYTEPAK